MQSDFVNNLSVDRREAVKLLGSGMLGASLPASLAFASGGDRPSGKLDYDDPYDNLYAFGKAWSSYEEQAIGAWHGLMYGRVGDKRMVPLFGFTGTGVLNCRIAENGDLQRRSRETGYFTDLETGEVLETWDNPWTGETVEVYHFYNDITTRRTGPEIPIFLMGANDESSTLMNEGTVFPDSEGKYPFILPFKQFGDDDLMLAWDYTHEYANPVTPDGWPKSSTGPVITPSEHFTMFVSKRELEDRSLPAARMRAGFSRQSQWWPWMGMGGTPYADGVLFGRMFSHKGLKGYGDVPRKVLDYIEKHAPEYLTLPEDGWEPTTHRIDTWKAYAMDIPPENPDYEGYTPSGFKVPTGKAAAG